MSQETESIAIGSIVSRRCGICHDRIDHSEHCTTCPACGLHNHADCWQENLGCGTYGCAQVNILKSGPDISIAMMPPPFPGGPQIGVRQNDTDNSSSFASATDVGIPWEHGLLAASTVAALLSLILNGWPCAIVWLMTRIYGEYRERPNYRWLVLISEAVNVVGFIVGQRLSMWS